jgi:type IV secretory pathway TraG/TraD family ATPase VirD4
MKGGKLDPALGLFLDELANVIPIQDLDQIASQGGGRGVLLMSIVQDIPQLRSRYGDDKMKTIFQNHPAKLILPGVSETDTAKFVTEIAGQFQENEQSFSFSHEGHKSRSEAPRMQQLITPDALRMLKPGNAVLIYRDLPPAVIQVRWWGGIQRYLDYAKMQYNPRVHSVIDTEPPKDRQTGLSSPKK